MICCAGFYNRGILMSWEKSFAGQWKNQHYHHSFYTHFARFLSPPASCSPKLVVSAYSFEWNASVVCLRGDLLCVEWMNEFVFCRSESILSSSRWIQRVFSILGFCSNKTIIIVAFVPGSSRFYHLPIHPPVPTVKSPDTPNVRFDQFKQRKTRVWT